MDNPATTDDVAARWRPLTDEETELAEVLLVDAWELVLARVPTLEQLVTDAAVTEGNLRRILCAMVLRVMKNTEGWREVAIDDYRRVRDTALSSGLLYLDDTELGTLQGSVGVGAFTITPFGAPNTSQPDPWWPIA